MTTVIYTLRITQILDDDSSFAKTLPSIKKEELPIWYEAWRRRIEDAMKHHIICDDVNCDKIQVFPSKKGAIV